MTLRLFYRIGVGIFLTTLAVLVALNVVLAFGGRGILSNPPFPVRILFGILGVFGAIGIVSLWIEMICNCLASRLTPLSKIGWLLLLVCTNMLGALIYYYVVFRHTENTLNRDGLVVP